MGEEDHVTFNMKSDIIDEGPELNMKSFKEESDIKGQIPKKGAFLLDREINYISKQLKNL